MRWNGSIIRVYTAKGETVNNTYVFEKYVWKNDFYYTNNLNFFGLLIELYYGIYMHGYLYHMTWIIQSEERKHENYYYSFIIWAKLALNFSMK